MHDPPQWICVFSTKVAGTVGVMSSEQDLHEWYSKAGLVGMGGRLCSTLPEVVQVGYSACRGSLLHRLCMQDASQAVEMLRPAAQLCIWSSSLLPCCSSKQAMIVRRAIEGTHAQAQHGSHAPDLTPQMP